MHLGGFARDRRAVARGLPGNSRLTSWPRGQAKNSVAAYRRRCLNGCQAIDSVSHINQPG